MLIEKYNKNQTYWILIEHITFNSSQSGCHDLLESSGVWQLDWCSSGWIVQVYDQQVSIVYSTRLTHTHIYIYIYIISYMYILFQVHVQLLLMFNDTFHIFNPWNMRHGLARVPPRWRPWPRRWSWKPSKAGRVWALCLGRWGDGERNCYDPFLVRFT